MKFPNPFKPWFVYRPSQLVRRVVRAAFPPRNPVQLVELPWGCPIEIDVRETIGRSIWAAGVYDLAVVEVLTRLADRRLLSLDAGANVGAMTGALAARSGEVWAFEPHPEIYQRLVNNVGRFTGLPGFAPCRVFDLALSDHDGTARLNVPIGFDRNQGLARVADDGDIPIRTAKLDNLLDGREVGVLKADVEGHELSLFRGAAEALRAGRIAHIVFEDHGGVDSPVAGFLHEFGYTVFEIGWRLGGPVLGTLGSGAHRPYEAPSYLATRHPGWVVDRCRTGGWQCLRRPASQPLS